jgi:hypothetical protein
LLSVTVEKKITVTNTEKLSGQVVREVCGETEI